MIVILNVIDCGLVLGELILDLHHVKGGSFVNIYFKEWLLFVNCHVFGMYHIL